MRMIRLTGFILAWVAAAFAQPDAASLVRKSASAFDSHRSYQYTEETTSDAGLPGGTSMITVVRGSAGKLRRDTKSGEVDVFTMISDGESTWISMPMLKQYSKVNAGAAEEAAALSGMETEPDDVFRHAKVLRSETLDVDGQPHDCWLVEARLDQLDTPVGVAMHDAIFTFWIDKTSGIELQTTTSSKMVNPMGGQAIEARTKTSKHSFQFDIPLDDAIFVFKPPAGATETNSLLAAFAPPAAEKSATKAAAEPAMAKVPAGEPKAYVPNLNPIEQIEPVLPAAAKAAGLHGMVTVLVTIDPGGTVVSSEALSGPQGLRQAALDTAKQWRFRPVIRDGRPVPAYTTGMVDFSDFEKPDAAGNLDMADEMKGVAREMELAAKFPRTPAQVLADTEQNLGGSGTQDRAYKLPELAKAALDAGALDKAVSYSNEMLQNAAEATQPKRDWNYGNEIYTGNEVLGLVAMRQDNLPKARQYLLESGKTPGSPTLGSFGPDLQLARELVKAGEKDTVLEFLESCRVFWKMGGSQLDALEAKIRAGGLI